METVQSNRVTTCSPSLDCVPKPIAERCHMCPVESRHALVSGSQSFIFVDQSRHVRGPVLMAGLQHASSVDDRMMGACKDCNWITNLATILRCSSEGRIPRLSEEMAASPLKN